MFPDLGLIVNPCAGAGADAAAVVSVLTALGAGRVITGPGRLGASFVDPARWPTEVVLVPDEAVPDETARDERGRACTAALARALAERGVPLLVVFGGDGTLADVAGALLGRPGAPVVCGIGSGSMNVGQLITCRLAELGSVGWGQLEVCPVPALIASKEARTAVAFNDVVFGTTLVGTRHGQLGNFDAAAYLEGHSRPGHPRGIGQPATRVLRRGRGGGQPHQNGEMPPYGEARHDGEVRLIARGRRVGGIVVGFTSPAYIGQAVTGGICLGSSVGLPAGCIVSDIPLARVGLTTAEVAAMPAIRSSFTSLSYDQVLIVEGARAGTVVLADGNPLAVLGPDDQAEVTVRPGALNVLRCANGPAWPAAINSAPSREGR